ncbi:MAG: D-alanyl-D-alanine carboxypeptidase family protein [Ruminococcus sp.]|nr:D-alanyl-D-alanine carboxypeptidase family protein [Ruminococcus sp.]
MKISKALILATAAALIFAFSAVSCGREVPKTEQSSESFSVAGGTVESTEPEEATTEAEPEETTAEEPDDFPEGGKISGVTLSYNEAEVFVGQTLTYPYVYDSIDEVWSSSDETIATVDSVGNITGKSEGKCIISVADKDDETKGAEVKVTVKKSSGTEVVNGITYIDGILIANKSYPLPQDYNPGGLTPETNAAFQELVDGAAKDGVTIYLSSGFRSYDLQSQIYNNYVNAYGQSTADTFSARPGYSEHQSGMAIDVNIIDDSFIGTPEAIWIEAHCNEYGFILRYPFGKQDVTGYKYEPWHIRYIGKENAEAFRKEADKRDDVNLTLEEYLGIDSYYH